MNGLKETRVDLNLSARPEVRALGNGRRISGIAAVFDDEADVGGFVESIAPGAFTKTLKDGGDILASANHDPAGQLLGRRSNGTLRVSTSAQGLEYEIDVNQDDPVAQAILARVARRDMTGSSFMFQTVRDEWDFNVQPPRRRLLEVALLELGPVVEPAYPQTTAAARAKLDARDDVLVAAAERRGLTVTQFMSAAAPGPDRLQMAAAALALLRKPV
jgi:HK97 family phage prohead protease